MQVPFVNKEGGGLRDWSFKAPLKTSLINTAGPWPIRGLEAPTLHTVENPRYNFTVGSPSSWFCIWRPDRPQIVSYCNRYLGKKIIFSWVDPHSSNPCCSRLNCNVTLLYIIFFLSYEFTISSKCVLLATFPSTSLDFAWLSHLSLFPRPLPSSWQKGNLWEVVHERKSRTWIF